MKAGATGVRKMQNALSKLNWFVKKVYAKVHKRGSVTLQLFLQ